MLHYIWYPLRRRNQDGNPTRRTFSIAGQFEKRLPPYHRSGRPPRSHPLSVCKGIAPPSSSLPPGSSGRLRHSRSLSLPFPVAALCQPLLLYTGYFPPSLESLLSPFPETRT